MFFDPQGFGFVAEIASRWRFIRQEAEELDAPLLPPEESAAEHHAAERLLQSGGWMCPCHPGSTPPGMGCLDYLLSYRGMLADGRSRTMPTTARLLSQLRGARLCALQRIRPGGYVAPHRRPDIGGRYLTLQFGLAMEARRSFLTVAGEAREEAPGRALAFNPAREHHAVNMGVADRIVLHIEFDPQNAGFDG